MLGTKKTTFYNAKETLSIIFKLNVLLIKRYIKIYLMFKSDSAYISINFQVINLFHA